MEIHAPFCIYKQNAEEFGDIKSKKIIGITRSEVEFSSSVTDGESSRVFD